MEVREHMRIHYPVALVLILGGVLAALGFAAAPAQAAGLPLIVSTTVDYTGNTLTVKGQNLGGSPNVTLDGMTLT